MSIPIFVTGQSGQLQDWKLDDGQSGVTLHVLDMGQDVAVTTQDQEIAQALRGVPKGTAVQVPVTIALSTFGGTAKVKYRAAGPPVRPQPR